MVRQTLTILKDGGKSCHLPLRSIIFGSHFSGVGKWTYKVQCTCKIQNLATKLDFSGWAPIGVTQMSLLQHQLKAMDEATKIVTNMEVGIGKRKHLCKRIALFKAGNILTD